MQEVADILDIECGEKGFVNDASTLELRKVEIINTVGEALRLDRLSHAEDTSCRLRLSIEATMNVIARRTLCWSWGMRYTYSDVPTAQTLGPLGVNQDSARSTQLAKHSLTASMTRMYQRERIASVALIETSAA